MDEILGGHAPCSEQRPSFNLIHLDTLLKVDVFVIEAEPGRELVVASPEDVVARKLL